MVSKESYYIAYDYGKMGGDGGGTVANEFGKNNNKTVRHINIHKGDIFDNMYFSIGHINNTGYVNSSTVGGNGGTKKTFTVPEGEVIYKVEIFEETYGGGLFSKGNLVISGMKLYVTGTSQIEELMGKTDSRKRNSFGGEGCALAGFKIVGGKYVDSIRPFFYKNWKLKPKIEFYWKWLSSYKCDNYETTEKTKISTGISTTNNDTVSHAWGTKIGASYAGCSAEATYNGSTVSNVIEVKTKNEVKEVTVVKRKGDQCAKWQWTCKITFYAGIYVDIGTDCVWTTDNPNVKPPAPHAKVQPFQKPIVNSDSPSKKTKTVPSSNNNGGSVTINNNTTNNTSKTTTTNNNTNLSANVNIGGKKKEAPKKK